MTSGISLDWRDDVPIYKQIKDRVSQAILSGSFQEGEATPSVRQLALELRVNPLTVSRAFSELADEGLLERRRGLGMFVAKGVQSRLLVSEKQIFLNEEWPQIKNKIKRLGISPDELSLS